MDSQEPHTDREPYVVLFLYLHLSRADVTCPRV